MILVKIPLKFCLDHLDRSLPTPEWHKDSGRYVWIALGDPATEELLDDARYYAGSGGPDNCSRGLIASARATVKAIENATLATAKTAAE